MKTIRAVALSALVVSSGIAAAIAPSLAQENASSSPNRAAVETIVREYLLANPEILREMADRLKAKDEVRADEQRAAVFKTAGDEIFNSEHQVVLGNPKGDVTLVEFFDYNCGYCKHALADTEELLKSDKKLRLVLKEFPVLGQDSVDAARVAVAVRMQAPSKYLDFHRKLLSAEAADGSTAIEIARELGLDMDRLSKDVTDPKTEEALISAHKLASQLGINGTPTYVVGEHVLPGAAGASVLKQTIANMRACGKAECS